MGIFRHYHKWISIHASAREATRSNNAITFPYDISIHASAREATTPTDHNAPPFCDFNPRLREGGDGILIREQRVKHISIHASAREATIIHVLTYFSDVNFNPRLREGGDCLADENHSY